MLIIIKRRRENIGGGMLVVFWSLVGGGLGDFNCILSVVRKRRGYYYRYCQRRSGCL